MFEGAVNWVPVTGWRGTTMMARHAHGGRAYGLDLLRASAALGVLFVHAVYFVWTLAQDWSLYLYFASLAVDLFFFS